MWTMARSAIGLFFRGRLFADPRKAYLLLALGCALTAAVFAAAVFAGAPPWAAAALAGFMGGGVQPFLFKNIRYR
jgi:hypothetical protein